jgi:hypothetical protein
MDVQNKHCNGCIAAASMNPWGNASLNKAQAMYLVGDLVKGIDTVKKHERTD